MNHFAQLYQVSTSLVGQLIDECHLLQKILDSYSLETVPTKKEPTDNVANETFIKMDEGLTTEKAENSIQDETDNEANKTITLDKKPSQKNVIRRNRPGYMGHLRLIANILRDKCEDKLLSECSLDQDVVGQWNEFKTGKLAALNELVKSKLVEETEIGEHQENVSSCLVVITAYKFFV